MPGTEFEFVESAGDSVESLGSEEWDDESVESDADSVESIEALESDESLESVERCESVECFESSDFAAVEPFETDVMPDVDSDVVDVELDVADPAEEPDPESDGSASATPCPVVIATPKPTARANPLTPDALFETTISLPRLNDHW